MDNAEAEFSGITGATAQVARHFLQMTDFDLGQAIQLYFDSPDLAAAAASTGPAPPVPTSSRPSRAGREDGNGVVHLDSDDEVDMDAPDNASDDESAGPSAAGGNAQNTYEDDEAMARRLQAEMYQSGGAMGAADDDDVRAPIARTTETLLGPGSHMGASESILDQLRNRRGPPRPRAGVFNQYSASSSIWDSSDPAARREGLATATGGASETSSKAAKLAELFRPPFELMSRMSWDDARDTGKEEQKWILVNIQDPSIFDCQALNRDIWKHEGIKETVKENFIFMQYAKDDPAGMQYMQYYFQHHEDPNAYPHIAIVDPRTGEQVKVWSGPPSPKPMDFLMQLHEFLDRYSLDPMFKNPVAKRKAEKSVLDVGKLSEEQMLDLALQNSLSNGSGALPKHEDPDALTKSTADMDKGKKAESDEEQDVDDDDAEENNSLTVFGSISSDRHHTEPANDPATTTRIQFRHSGGRIVRRFSVDDPVRRIYEWLKADPIDGKTGLVFELKKAMGGADLLDSLDQTIGEAGLKNSTVMIEYIED